MLKLTKDFFIICIMCLCFLGAQYIYMSYYNVGEKPLRQKKSGYVSTQSSGRFDQARCGTISIYTTTWCGACKAMRKDLESHRVSYKDYVVNTSKSLNARFENKVRAAGLKVYYPRVEINGKFVENYPVAYLDEKYNLCKRR